MIYHYKEVFGIEIFKKRILETVSGITQKDLNTLERNYINDAAIEATKKGGFTSITLDKINKALNINQSGRHEWT